MRLALDKRFGIEMSAGNPVVVWLMQCSAHFVEQVLCGPRRQDGLRAPQRADGAEGEDRTSKKQRADEVRACECGNTLRRAVRHTGGEVSGVLEARPQAQQGSAVRSNW